MSEGIESQNRCADPEDWHWEDKISKHLVLKTNRDQDQEKHGTVGNRDPTLIGLVCKPMCPEIQHKSNRMKSTQNISTEDPLNKFKMASGEVGTCRDFIQKHKLWWAPFLYSYPNLLVTESVSAIFHALSLAC